MALFICYIFCTLFYFSLFLYQLVSLNAPATVTSSLNGSSPVLLSSNNDADDALLIAGINVVVTAKRNYKWFIFLSVFKLHKHKLYYATQEFSTIFLISFCIICSSLLLLLLLSRSYNL
jgi:hypothetical protein